MELGTRQLVSGTLPCPKCGMVVHVVLDLREGVGRWCCPRCQVVGDLPCPPSDGGIPRHAMATA